MREITREITVQGLTSSRSQPNTIVPRVTPIDGLRTFAIAFVVLYHLHIPFFGGGFIGVNVFFTLSGYLITSLLLREQANTGRISLGRFWLRRGIRLYPALVAVVVFVVLLWSAIAVYSKSNVDSWFDAGLALSYVGNIARWVWHRSMGPLAPTWSLATEEQFYLIWPPILAVLLASRVRRVAIMVALGMLAVSSAIASMLLYRTPGGGATPDIYFSPVLNAGPLLVGAILALLLRSGRVLAWLGGAAGTVLTALGGLFLLALELTMPSNWTKLPVTFGVLLPLVGIASAVLIAGLVGRVTMSSRALSRAPIAWFGRNASYSLYLWHIPVIALILPLVPGPLGAVAAILAAAAVAIASHYHNERPVARLRHRLNAHGRAAGRFPAPHRWGESVDDSHPHASTEAPTLLGVLR